MKMSAHSLFAGFLFLGLLGSAPVLFAGDAIPKAAWKRGIGQPLEHAGGAKPALLPGMIDDGYWQGAPVGGVGSADVFRHLSRGFPRRGRQRGRRQHSSE